MLCVNFIFNYECTKVMIKFCKGILVLLKWEHCFKPPLYIEMRENHNNRFSYKQTAMCNTECFLFFPQKHWFLPPIMKNNLEQPFANQTGRYSKPVLQEAFSEKITSYASVFCVDINNYQREKTFQRQAV